VATVTPDEPPARETARNDAETLNHPPVAAAAAQNLPTQDRLVSGALIANRYQLGAEVGRGGGGAVYQAFDRGAQLSVAVKLLNPHKWSGQRSTDQLYRELRFGRSIQHPNVCRIYDVLEAEAACFLVMEYASAGTLRTTLSDAATPRSFEEKLTDARGLIAGLTAIHRAGLVHRDFKPENILRMADGRLVVSDFGLTRALDQSTFTTGLAGTPGYLAPEVLSGLRESQASDVWSLGVVLHEIFVGCRPDISSLQGAPAVGRKRGAAEGDDPRQAAVGRVYRACLALDPHRRPASAAQVEALFETALRRTSRAKVRWPLGLGGAALGLALAGLLLFLAFPSRPPPSAEPPSRPVSDRSADWSRSRLISVQWGSLCLDAVPPERRIVRAVTQWPETAFEIDVERGSWTEAASVPEGSCFVHSPDGQTVLFTGQGPRGQQVMFAPRPDGRGAVPLVQGSHARWLPSGRAFFFVTDERRAALADIQGAVTPFFSRGTAPFEIRDTAVDDEGTRAAVVARYRLPAEETRLELYDLQARSLMRSWTMNEPTTQAVKFDPLRRTFQFAEGKGTEAVWSEITRGGETRVVGRLPGKTIQRAVRAKGGFVFSALGSTNAYSLYRTRPDRSSQYISARARQLRVSPRGDLVYVQVDKSDLGTIMLKRETSAVIALSDPDMFGDPNISADGQLVVYDHLLTGEIFSCDLSRGDALSKCKQVWVDRGLVAGPGLALEPTGLAVAYVAHSAQAAASHLSLRLLSLSSHQPREVTRVDAECASRCEILWSAPGTVRVCTRSTVTEVDVVSGKKTTVRSLPGAAADACTPPENAAFGYDLRKRDHVEFRFVPDLIESP
jgi:serine/threonine protein kinase